MPKAKPRPHHRTRRGIEKTGLRKLQNGAAAAWRGERAHGIRFNEPDPEIPATGDRGLLGSLVPALQSLRADLRTVGALAFGRIRFRQGGYPSQSAGLRYLRH